MVYSPLDQFTVWNLFGIDAPIFHSYYYLTNLNLYLVIGLITSGALFYYLDNDNRLLPDSWVVLKETLYASVYSLVSGQLRGNAQVYFPAILTLFILILFTNLLGMTTYSFAATAHIGLTSFLSLTIIIGVTILGFNQHGLGYFALLVPAGTPLILAPVLTLIEFISYVARALSLCLRLTVNILAGHLLFHIIGGFSYWVMGLPYFLGIVAILPMGFLYVFTFLEFGICAIQRYVFCILTASYIKDAVELH